MERTHKMEVLVDVIPMASGKILYTAKVDIAGSEGDFSLERESMRSLMIAVREEAEVRKITRGDIEILSEFAESDLSEDDVEVWETNIFEL